MRVGADLPFGVNISNFPEGFNAGDESFIQAGFSRTFVSSGQVFNPNPVVTLQNESLKDSANANSSGMNLR